VPPKVVPVRRGLLLAVASNGGFGSRLLNGANGDLIGIPNWPHVVFGERDYSLRVPRCSHELDLNAVRFIDFDYGPKIAATKAVLGQVPV
jgi:hypothetical protein